MATDENPSRGGDKEAWEILAGSLVRYDPGASSAKSGEILVGLGRAIGAGIVLNHKERSGSGPTVRSVSDLVFRATDEVIEKWKGIITKSGQSTLVIEDLSLDTCFAIMLLEERLNPNEGKSSEEKSDAKLEEWLKYVNAWEAGFYLDTNGLENSIAILHACMAHGYLRAQGLAGGSQPGRSPESPPVYLTRDFRQCIEFLTDAYSRFEDPLQAVGLPGLRAYKHARSQFLFEQQQYLITLNQAITCQLLLPLKRSKDRVIVDAMIFTEHDSTGVTKIFARTDKKNSWTGNGFTLLAIYRPHEVGTGNDITVSVDPDSGTTLEDLWVALENEEDGRWGAERPASNPRQIESYTNLELYRRLERPSGRDPDQPWWDNQGLHTILGAPKNLPDKSAGTKLDWPTVMRLLWETYKQVPPEQIKLENLAPKDPKANLYKADWSDDAKRDIADTDTLEAWLAYVSMCRARTGEISARTDPEIGKLPTRRQFDIVKLPGARIYIHGEGATFFNDWTPIETDILPVTELLRGLCVLKCKYTELTGSQQHERIASLQSKVLGQDKLDTQAQADWDDLILEVKRKRAELVAKYLSLDASPEMEELRDVVERRWGITEGRRRADLLVDRLDKDTQTNILALKQRRERWLSAGAAGLAFALLVNQALRVAQDKFTTNLYAWGLEMNQASMTPGQILRLREVAQESASWEAYVFYGSVAGLLLGLLFALWPGLRSLLRRKA